MPRLPQILAATDVEKLRRAMSNVRRRLLWTKLYGSCHLRAGEGGDADAFDTLMQAGPLPVPPSTSATPHASPHARPHRLRAPKNRIHTAPTPAVGTPSNS